MITAKEHQSVLLQASIDALQIRPDGMYIDATFGRGGHSAAILQRLGASGRLVALDRDLQAIAYAKQQVEDARFSIVHTPFSHLLNVVQSLGYVGLIDGILFDLGVSSPQLDEPQRGFSFLQEGPLDMRMDQSTTMTAEGFVNQATVDVMTEVFKKYGEERYSKRIARAIEKERLISPIKTTLQLAEIIKAAHPKWERHKHPATRVFQAIRIYINQELDDIEQALSGALTVLAPKGRLVVISFHSLEDRLVKTFMKKQEEGERIPLNIPVFSERSSTVFRRIGKAQKPSEIEIEQNPRSRSAILRVGEKLL